MINFPNMLCYKQIICYHKKVSPVIICVVSIIVIFLTFQIQLLNNYTTLHINIRTLKFSFFKTTIYFKVCSRIIVHVWCPLANFALDKILHWQIISKINQRWYIFICNLSIFPWILGRSWSYGSWIYNYLCNQCLSPLKLWVWIQLMARCTRYNIMWSSLSVTCGRSVVFSGFLHL
jgi:hypothetical protein